MTLLEGLARLHLERSRAIIVGCVLFTALMLVGIPHIQLQTDFQGSLPNDLSPIAAQDRVESAFGNTNGIIVLVQLDDAPKEPGRITDIRDPRTVRMLSALQEELGREPMVDSVSSMAGLFPDQPGTKAEVKRRLAASPSSFLNRDYTATMLSVTIEQEMTEDNIRRATEMIRSNIDQTPTYPGLEVTVTGTPVMRNTISDLLISDSTRIIALASGFILVLLTLVRGRFYGPATFAPLFLGLLWTLGAMGWLGIPLTIATISLGSMLLGLGVEYGSFITERIVEEIHEEPLEAAIMEAVPNTGRAVLGSSTTDLVGFLALLLASISFIRDLGLTLALGEFLTLSAALLLTPALIVEYTRWSA